MRINLQGFRLKNRTVRENIYAAKPQQTRKCKQQSNLKPIGKFRHKHYISYMKILIATINGNAK